MNRWRRIERGAHWLYALLFIICLVSGLLMWIPSTRELIGGARLDISQRHAATGFAMVAMPLLMLVIFDRRRLRSGLRQINRWSVDDRRWFRAALRGRSLRGGAMPPQGRFNAGQKATTVLVAAMAVGFVVTGGLLLGKAGLPAWLVSRAFWLHGFLAIAGLALLAGHLGMALLTRHGRASLRAMFNGRLAEDVARERHSLWWAKAEKERTDAEAGEPVDGGSG